MRRYSAALVAVIAAVGIGAAAVASAASLTVKSDHLATFDRPGPTTTSSSSTSSTSSSTTAPPDTTAPALTTLEAFDTDANGKFDRIVATFDETLNADYTAGTSPPWTINGLPSGGSLASVAVSGAQATLTITEGTGQPHTAVPATFTVALAQAAGGIRDAAGNKSSFAATNPTDKAGPVPVLLTITNGTAGGSNASTAGRPDHNDIIRVRFSERLAVSTICSSWSGNTSAQPPGTWANNALTAEITNGTTNDSLTVAPTPGQPVTCTPRFGEVQLDNRFVSADTEFVGNGDHGRTELRWAPASPDGPGATNDLSLELGAGAGLTVANPAQATYTPPSTSGAQLTDPAGNVAVGSVQTATGATQF